MAGISINKKLNLVLPIEIESGKIWIHSVPLSREVFESNYLLLTKTLANLYVNGIGPSFAPRVALLSLKETAKEMNSEEDISVNLINEIYRLTNVLMPIDNKWQTIPYMEAKNRRLIDEQTISELENAIVYFIVASAVHLKSELQMAYQGLKNSWNAQTTLLNVTEYGNFLMTSTTKESTGEKVSQLITTQRVSSVPS